MGQSIFRLGVLIEEISQRQTLCRMGIAFFLDGILGTVRKFLVPQISAVLASPPHAGYVAAPIRLPRHQPD